MITKEPRVLTMDRVQMSGGERKMLADHAIVDLAADNSVQHVHADGNVRVSNAGRNAGALAAGRDEAGRQQHGGVGAVLPAEWISSRSSREPADTRARC